MNEIVCNFHDYLILWKPHGLEWSNKANYIPLQIPFTGKVVDYNEDYANSVNTVQSHTKYGSEYYPILDPQGNQYCCFYYQLEQKDWIVIYYIQNLIKDDGLVRAGTVAQRNDLGFSWY